MLIELVPAALDDKPILQRMMELYQYDFSETCGSDLDAHGCFGYPYLDHYWVETGRHPFIVRVDVKLAGFVLVNRQTFVPGNELAIAEFFVMRKYRRLGVGRTVAFQVFDLFRGKWEIQQLEANLPAQAFWRNVVSAYTKGQYRELFLEEQYWRGPVQCFDNTVL